MRKSVARSVVALVVLFAQVTTSATAQLRFWRTADDRDIASVHVAVQSIAPFEDYIAALQPTFKLSADQARQQAIAQTRRHATQTRRELVASITSAITGVEPPPPADTAEETTPPATTTTQPATTQPATTQPAATQTAGAQTTPPAAATAAGAAAAAAAPETTDLDPMVTYNAATSLMQYVAILNSYVRDAAVSTRSRPYIVRLLVSVMPTASLRGYDAYSTVSFFSEPGPAKQGRLAASQWAESAAKDLEWAHYSRAAAQEDVERLQKETPATPDMIKAREQAIFKKRGEMNHWDMECRRLRDILDLMERARGIRCKKAALRVIPLLVTDNFEASLHSDTLEQMRELSAQLSSTGKRNSLLGRIRSKFDDSSKTLARNLNGLMTVTQVAGNSIQVRLGAMYGNRVDAMIPRTYGVTLLVLYPTAESELRTEEKTPGASEIIPCSVASYTADTFFRHGRSGRIARQSDDEDAIRLIHSLAPATSWKEADDWMQAVRDDNFEKFRRLVGSDTRAAALWPRLVAGLSTTSRSSGQFQAGFRRMTFFSNESGSSVIDNGKDASTLTLIGGANLVPDRIAGRITVKRKSGPDLVLNSSMVDVTNDGRMATLTFPSIATLIKTDDVEKIKAHVRYQLSVRDWQSRADQAEFVWEHPVSYIRLLEPPKDEAPKPKVAFTMQSTAKSIHARGNTGSVRIVLTRDPKATKFPMHFAVESGEIVAVTPALELSQTARVAKDEGEYKIDLDNLTIGSTLTIKAWRLDETDREKKIEAPPLTFEVRPGEAKEAK